MWHGQPNKSECHNAASQFLRGLLLRRIIAAYNPPTTGKPTISITVFNAVETSNLNYEFQYGSIGQKHNTKRYTLLTDHTQRSVGVCLIGKM